MSQSIKHNGHLWQRLIYLRLAPLPSSYSIRVWRAPWILRLANETTVITVCLILGGDGCNYTFHSDWSNSDWTTGNTSSTEQSNCTNCSGWAVREDLLNSFPSAKHWKYLSGKIHQLLPITSQNVVSRKADSLSCSLLSNIMEVNGETSSVMQTAAKKYSDNS